VASESSIGVMLPWLRDRRRLANDALRFAVSSWEFCSRTLRIVASQCFFCMEKFSLQDLLENWITGLPSDGETGLSVSVPIQAGIGIASMRSPLAISGSGAFMCLFNIGYEKLAWRSEGQTEQYWTSPVSGLMLTRRDWTCDHRVL